MKTKSSLDQTIQKILSFRNDRDWEQFHNLKDLAIGLNIESSELLELFLWKNKDEIDELTKDSEFFQKIKDELADILIFALLIKDKLDIDIEEAIEHKLKKNAEKYPVDKSKGKACKYSEFK